MLRRIWLFFAQACTLCVAALFVVSTLRPDLLPRPAAVRPGNVIVTQETTTPVVTARVASYADAAKKAMPAVVAIFTSKQVRSRVPLADDPLFRRYFPDLDRQGPQRQTSLGSGVIVSPEGYVITNHHVIEGADDIQLVLSDGRRTTGVDTLDAAKMAADRGVRIHVVGLGSVDGVVGGPGGLSIFMQLDEPTLREVARMTGGEYYHAGTADELRSVYQGLGSRLQVQTRETELAPVLAFVAAILSVAAASLSMHWLVD